MRSFDSWTIGPLKAPPAVRYPPRQDIIFVSGSGPDRTAVAGVQVIQDWKTGPEGSVVSFRTGMRERRAAERVPSVEPLSTTSVTDSS